MCAKCDDFADQAEVDMNRESEPCSGEDEHKFPPEYYECWVGDSSAGDYCCLFCGWSARDIKEHADAATD